MDDGITGIPFSVPAETFLNILNEMHPAIQFTISKPTETFLKNENVKTINFLSVNIYVTMSGDVKTDVFYKETNAHDYLHYKSHHPLHVKNNIPYVLAKRIILFTSDDDMMENNLRDLKEWLLECEYPPKIIDRGIHNARLQGPAPKPPDDKIIPFISTYYSNYDNSHIVETTRSLITNSKNPRKKEVFKNAKFIEAHRQPPNLLRRLTNSSFITGNRNENRKPNGIYCCKRLNCKICKLYLQECSSFVTANGSTWVVKCHVDCHSKNVIYYQICNFCQKVSDIGKTDDLRERTNNHITKA